MENKKTKLLFENWRKFLIEQEQITKSDINKTTSIIKMPYEQFVQKFKAAVADPKVMAVVKAGLNDASPKEDDQIRVEDAKPIPVINLRPTQNEVVFMQSLGGEHGPLQKPELLEKMLVGGDVVVPPKPEATPYVVTAEGKFIVDGHHRWSSLFCINPKANIVTTNLSFRQQLPPLQYLKIVQMAIAADINKLPTTGGGGVNLFKVDENFIKTEVQKQIEAGAQKQKIMEIFAKHGHKDINAINALIWSNVSQLKNNKPVAGAPVRAVMPQTDDAKGFANKLKNGEVNFANIKKTPTNSLKAQSATQAQQVTKEELIIDQIASLILEEIKKNKK